MHLRAKDGIELIQPHMLPATGNDATPTWAFLNSNESAFGPSPFAISAAQAASRRMERYLEFPDRLLAPAIGARFDLDPDRITVGQGSDDLIARLARAYLRPGEQIMRSANGYQKVPNYAYAAGGTALSVPDHDFVPSVYNMIAAMTEEVRIVYLANPENPAGTYLSGAEVRRLHAAMPDTALMILDCAYEEYVDAPDFEAGAALVDALPNVILCRTFSKIFGLAGARVGWCYGPAEIIDVTRRVGLTFPVAGPSAAAAIAALEDRGHVDFVRAETIRNRASLIRALQNLGLRVIPSQANFVLVELPDAAMAEANLRGDGILVRRLASPAFDGFMRITIGTQPELDACIHSLSAFLGAR